MSNDVSRSDLAALAKDGWDVVSDTAAVKKTFRFKSFKHAFDWMSRVAVIAEELDHHPEWFNIYDRVHVRLISHDAKRVTMRDVLLARRMDGLVNGLVS